MDASIQKKCLKGHDLEMCGPYLQLLLNVHPLTLFYVCVMINENISIYMESFMKDFNRFFLKLQSGRQYTKEMFKGP